MIQKRGSIQQQLMTVIMLTSGIVVLITCMAFFIYEVITFRKSTVEHLSTLARIIANNSTASLAFNNTEDAKEILEALKAEPQILDAALYKDPNIIFSSYSKNGPQNNLPAAPKRDGYYFTSSHILAFEPVIQGNTRLGTLYLKADMKAMYDRLILYAYMALLVVLISFLVAYLLSRFLQKKISKPISALTRTARTVSERHDYSVRAKKMEDDELGFLTDSFNQMLQQIQKQNEEITSFNQTLEGKVHERTVELEMANQELEAFSYSVSHDLRAPLRHILLNVEMFNEQFLNAIPVSAQDYVKNISKNAGKMNQLIEDLLTYSKVSKKELVKEKIDMQKLVAELCEEFCKIEANRKINIELDQLPAAFGDVVSIKQLWINLISNAVKYTRNKNETLIQIGAQEKPNEILYYIKDNGAGFDMQYYNKLFSPFQRLHSPKEFEGTGVGLAIVSRIVSRHGGRISAQSSPGAGATFYFSLAKTDDV